jgi:N-acyl-D-aspartate/D-glutamate deacylase
MHDLVIRGGKVVDGTGAPAETGDVVVDDGVVMSVGGRGGAARREIDADGLLVTPGWVDIHTHFDGQATWDPYITPSSWHGVTTVVMGNCGVG